MFGFVTANMKELTKAQQDRYGSVYCGICRRIRLQSGQIARMGLSYDMAFLALLLMSLYEPEEESGRNGCMMHPIKRRPWVDNCYIRYCADMNVALAYYNCLDDWQDDKKRSAKLLADCLEEKLPAIAMRRHPGFFGKTFGSGNRKLFQSGFACRYIRGIDGRASGL